MTSLLNPDRPPVFCPGCGHERVVRALDQALTQRHLAGGQVAIVSDIGCSGLFDTFFNTHAFHGLHGRALTYATGIKLARPELTVIVTMGDGGLGIGGAHVLSACRRNVDLTLLVLNNFNYGMTGGQCSATTPCEARVGSGFLNRLEPPLDICRVAAAAGAPRAQRASAYDRGLAAAMADAIGFCGFALIDIWGVCPGRYTRRNPLNPAAIAAQLAQLPPVDDRAAGNARTEYGQAYRRQAARLAPAAEPVRIEKRFAAPRSGRQEIVILGSAGQRIITAGELVCLAGAAAGLHASQKNDYPITVMRGHSISELILTETEIGYTGIAQPTAVLALAAEGVARRQPLFSRLPAETLVLKAADVDLPPSAARIVEVDFAARRIRSADRALAALSLLAKENQILSLEMLRAALALRFAGPAGEQALALVESMAGGGR